MKLSLMKLGTKAATMAGGTIDVDIPKEWFSLSYDEFLERVITLASAAHYGFTNSHVCRHCGS